ncbi:hypothetical protein C1645_775727 [Glomus cerebriforme]|uniref:Uncharacterized protein n=1 Tax=Glomus cerebriforme TaxID=658196 RepID=A0A397SPT0_9GLOM|nr:hypothetical protein C1645_775727 [Glomus cerebriforme]
MYTCIKIKISSSEKMIERSIKRNYKRPLKNPYMIFMVDCSEALKLMKKKKNFAKFFHERLPYEKKEKKRKTRKTRKIISSLWGIAPKQIKDVYEQIFEDYKKSKPKFIAFCQNELEGQDNSPSQSEDQDSSPSQSEDPSNDTEEIYEHLFNKYIDY